MTTEELKARLNARHTAGDPMREAVLALIAEWDLLAKDFANAVRQADAAAARADAAEANLASQVSMAEQGARQYALLEAKLAEAERRADEINERAAQIARAQHARMAAAESREKALREALRHAVEWFWGIKPESETESFDRVAVEFYNETGIMRPGKSVPLAMNPPWTEEERRSAWDAWVKRKRDALEAECRAALAAGERDA